MVEYADVASADATVKFVTPLTVRHAARSDCMLVLVCVLGSAAKKLNTSTSTKRNGEQEVEAMGNNGESGLRGD